MSELLYHRQREQRRTASPAGRLLTLATAVLAMILAGQLVFHLLLAPRLTLRRVVLRSELKLAEEEVLSLAGLREGERYFSVDEAEVERRLEEHPAVAEAEVRKVFPDTLQISLKARRGMALLLAQGRDGSTLPLMVDREGVVIQVGLEGSDSDLPLVSGVELVGEEARAGFRLPEGLKPLLEDLDRLSREAPELFRLISEVRLVPQAQQRYELLVYPVAYRMRLRLGERLQAGSLANALVILDVLERRKPSGQVDELDLRGRDVVYRFREEG